MYPYIGSREKLVGDGELRRSTALRSGGEPRSGLEAGRTKETVRSKGVRRTKEAGDWGVVLASGYGYF